MPYFGYHGDDLVYGFVPLHPEGGTALNIPDTSALLAVAGVGAAIFDSPDTISSVLYSSFTVPAGEARSFGYYAYVGSGDPAGLHASYLELRGEAPVALSGTLDGAVVGASVAVLD